VRALKVLLVTFFLIALVTGYIMYNSGTGISIMVKTSSENNAADCNEPADASGSAEAAGLPGAAGPQGVAGPEEDPSLSAVRRVHETFQSLEVEDEEGFYEIIALLPDIDWSVYTREYGAAGDNGLGAVELLEWIADNPLTMQGDNMLNIFRANKGLDGVVAEQYSVITGSFYRLDTERFVKLLAMLDEQSIDRVCYHTAYNNYYHLEPEEAIEAINARFEGRALSEKETYVVETMVKSMSAYVTQEST
jgi:hypothetical protein